MVNWRGLFAIAVVGLAMGAAPPAFTRTAPARQYLDRRTAATVIAMGRPLIFARERTALAVNARDYVSLVAIDVNRGGQHAQYWFAYSWSTIDEGDSGRAAATPADWLLIADGRPIQLRQVPAVPSDVGVGESPLSRPVRSARPMLFAADAEVLRYVGTASDLSVQCGDGGNAFTLWRDAREELKAFLGGLSP